MEEYSIIKTFGYCRYSFEEDYVHIHNLFVYPEYRRQGKAKELLIIAISEIKDIGWKEEIQIVANPQDDSISLEKLKSFYEGLGLDVFDCYR